MIQTRRSLLLLALLATTSFSGCVAHKTIRVTQHVPNHLTLLVDLPPNANAGVPLSVDVLTIADQHTFNELLPLPAHDWFATRSAYLAQHSAQVRVTSFEWTPGTAVPPIDIDKAPSAAGILLFVNYNTPGAHSSVLPLAAIVRIQCNASNFQVQILP